MPASTTPRSVLIVGGGTWGLAIAYRLALRGYGSIKILEAEDFPSTIAAGNDLNKIVEEPESPPCAADDDITYAWAKIETIAADLWRNDPVYSANYHPTGFIYAAVSDQAYEKVERTCQGKPGVYQKLDNVQAFRKAFPSGVLTGDLPGWRGFWRKDRAGWVAARQTMLDLRKAVDGLGIQIAQGPSAGRVRSFVYNSSNSDIVGAVTADGIEHFADTVVLAAGAASDQLLDFKKQLRPTAWTLAHIPVSSEEAKLYHDMPVLYGVDRGFCIEPTLTSLEMKVCDEHPGYINLQPDTNIGEDRSVPIYRDQIPIEAEQRMRTFLRETMPHLAERRFSSARLCWDADTVDRLFLIDSHPLYPSLVLAVGGSGHGFMCSPGVGVLVADLLDGKLEDRLAQALRWRPDQAIGRDWFDVQDRFGIETKVIDLKSIIQWTEHHLIQDPKRSH